MRVTVLFFGQLQELVGLRSDELTLDAGASLAEILDHYSRKAPRLNDFAPSLAMAINQEYAFPDDIVSEGDEVAFLPPVSGGSPEPFVSIVRERIVPHDIVPRLERPEDGAIVVFDGVVRNYSRGRRTEYLEYESYESMALQQMEALAQEALAKYQIRDVAMVHRLGRIEIGESSVLIAVFSAHRAAAFDACRFLIDTLKKTVPIWKKEFFRDGAVWADGEPFPPEITTGPGTKPPKAASK